MSLQTHTIKYNNKGNHEVLSFNRLCLTEMALAPWIMGPISSFVNGLVAKKICYNMVPNMTGVSNHRQHKKGKELLSSNEMIWTHFCATSWIGGKVMKIWSLLIPGWINTAAHEQLNTQYKINKHFLPAWHNFIEVRVQIKMIFNNYFSKCLLSRNFIFWSAITVRSAATSQSP